MNTGTSREDKVTYVATCCGPCTPWQAVFWGIVLVGLGGLGLVSAFVPIPIALGRYILPALLVLWGAFCLLSARRTRA